MKEFHKEYSSLWGFGVKDADAHLFIEKVKRSGTLESMLPLVFTLKESNSLIGKLENETVPDIDSGECPLCEAVTESISMLKTMTDSAKKNMQPIPERFIGREKELYDIFIRLDHRRQTYLHPLTEKSRFSEYVNKNNEDIRSLLTSFSYATESHAKVSDLADIKNENEFVKEITKKKFANEFVKLISDDVENISYTPQKISEICNNINKLTSLSNMYTVLESKRVDDLGVRDSLKAILENTSDVSNNLSDVASSNEAPAQFVKMSEDVLTDLKKMARDHEVERLSNGGLYSKALNTLRYAGVYAVGSAVSPALSIMAILVMMTMRKNSDSKTRGKLIRDLETELHLIQERIRNEEDKSSKYQLMRLEAKLVHNIDRLKKKSAVDEFKTGRTY